MTAADINKFTSASSINVAVFSQNFQLMCPLDWECIKNSDTIINETKWKWCHVHLAAW